MQRFDREKYTALVKKSAKRTPWVRNCFAAFFVGGGICLLGEAIVSFYLWLGLGEDNAGVAATVTLIFLAAFLTAIGVFDRIARFAGAGTLVPVTGFSNAVVSPAMDNKSEGWILGVGAKIFTVAGPVLLYGILSGALYGVIYFVWQSFSA